VCHRGLKCDRCGVLAPLADRGKPAEVGVEGLVAPDDPSFTGEVLTDPASDPGWKGVSRINSIPGDAGGENGGVAVAGTMADGVLLNRLVGEACGWTETKLCVSI
jgi:hypothetical protein